MMSTHRQTDSDNAPSDDGYTHGHTDRHTHSDTAPSDDECCFRSHEEGVETKVVDGEVHPPLPGKRTLPVPTGIVWG